MSISKEERERLMNAGAQAWYALRVLHVKLHEDATQPPDEIQELFSACVEHIAELQQALENVSEVYLEITNGNISKPGTNPTVVLDYARESNEQDHAEDMRMKDERIGELEAENQRLHSLYYAEREAHNSRGGA